MPMGNSHKYLSTDGTNYNSLTVTGSSNCWVHSTITKGLNTWLWSQSCNMHMGLKKIAGAVPNHTVMLSVSY